MMNDVHERADCSVIEAHSRNDVRREGDILLFQLDSEIKKDIYWGDMGVANFFISLEDLKKRDFSNVVYNWDCY